MESINKLLHNIFESGAELNFALQMFTIGSETKESQIIRHHKPFCNVKIIEMLVRFGYNLFNSNLKKRVL